MQCSSSKFILFESCFGYSGSFVLTHEFFFLCLINLFILFIYFWLSQVFVAARGLSLVAVSGGYSLLWCAGFSLRWLLLLWSTGSKHAGFSSCGMQAQQLWLTGSRAQAQQLWRTGLVAARHVGSSPCALHWQADSQALRHQGSPNPDCFDIQIAHPASVGGCPAEVGGGSVSPWGQGHWQQKFWEVLLGVSPPRVCLTHELLIILAAATKKSLMRF